jgi:glycine/D-amino acid oxidase-like deaminating enzyme
MGSVADVVVVGGGIAGTSAAVALAEAGRQVVLVERAGIAAGASGRNSGVVQHPFDPVLVQLHLATLERYRALEAAGIGGFALAHEPAGLLMVTHAPEVAAGLADELSRSHPQLAPTFLAPGDARRTEPALAADVAACRIAIGYPVAPAAATHAYADLARARGVSIDEGRAAALDIADGRVRGVRRSDGTTVAAEEVVVAAGPWSPALIDPGGVWRPIRPNWGVVVSVTLVTPARHVLEQAELEIEPDDEPSAGPPAGPPGEQADFSLVPAGTASSLGSTFLDREPDGDAWVPRLLAHGRRFVPGIAEAEVGPVRVCARPVSLDGRPLVGRVAGVDGLWIVAGHGPWGISTGPGSSALLAELMTGLRAAPPPALDPARFGAPPVG